MLSVSSSSSSLSSSSSSSSSSLVAVFGGVVLGRDDETAALAGAAVDGLDDVDHLLLVLDGPVDLVVVARAQINHHVLVAEEEHDLARRSRSRTRRRRRRRR